MAYTAFWTKAPPGRKKNIPTINIEELSFISEKLSSLILVSFGSKGKGFGFEKGKMFWAEGKKVCLYAHAVIVLVVAKFGIREVLSDFQW